MSRVPSFMFGMVAGAVLVMVAMNYHVVRATDGFHFIAKQPARLAEVYVDIRQFGMSDWAGHPQLASDLVQANQQNLIGGSAVDTAQESVNKIMPNWPTR